jgi:hypothetical protein
MVFKTFRICPLTFRLCRSFTYNLKDFLSTSYKIFCTTFSFWERWRSNSVGKRCHHSACFLLCTLTSHTSTGPTYTETWVPFQCITTQTIRLVTYTGHAVAWIFEALCYKPEDRGIESRCHRFFFNLPNPSSRTMLLGFTQPLTEMRTRRYFWG